MALNRTQIDWAKNPNGTQGYTWNPITGCLSGCEYCYARRLAHTRLKERYLANQNLASWGQFAEDRRGDKSPHEFGYGNPFYPRFWEDRLPDPLRTKGSKPKGIFVCDMSDLFGIGIPERWTRRVLGLIRLCSDHRFYLLTKQPQNLIKFSPFPENCWVGFTATNHLQAKKAMYCLRDIQAKKRFMSFEPLLADMGFNDTRWATANQIIKSLDWVIIGAQTKPYKPPEIEWVREIVEACDKAGVKVFLKDNLMPLLKPVYAQAGCISNFFTGGDDETPILRQELPE